MIQRHKAHIPHGVAVGITAQWPMNRHSADYAVGMQSGAVMLWYTAEQHAATSVRTFEIYGTGYNIPENRKFIGTVLDGNFVWHVFEKMQS